jgi:osmotically-inducible protein OsmY
MSSVFNRTEARQLLVSWKGGMYSLKNTWSTTLALSFAVACGCPALSAQQAAPDNPGAQQTAPDNTRTNQRDRSKTEPTADQSKNDAGDRKLAQKIRKSITDDKNLSTYAHNVKVIAQNGTVTLKGPVRSEDEKQTVVQKAAAEAGAGNVNDELTVAPARKKGSEQ